MTGVLIKNREFGQRNTQREEETKDWDEWCIYKPQKVMPKMPANHQKQARIFLQVSEGAWLCSLTLKYWISNVQNWKALSYSVCRTLLWQPWKPNTESSSWNSDSSTAWTDVCIPTVFHVSSFFWKAILNITSTSRFVIFESLPGASRICLGNSHFTVILVLSPQCPNLRRKQRFNFIRI